MRVLGHQAVQLWSLDVPRFSWARQFNLELFDRVKQSTCADLENIAARFAQHGGWSVLADGVYLDWRQRPVEPCYHADRMGFWALSGLVKLLGTASHKRE